MMKREFKNDTVNGGHGCHGKELLQENEEKFKEPFDMQTTVRIEEKKANKRPQRSHPMN